jgi:hypothetical protein
MAEEFLHLMVDRKQKEKGVRDKIPSRVYPQ